MKKASKILIVVSLLVLLSIEFSIAQEKAKETPPTKIVLLPQEGKTGSRSKESPVPIVIKKESQPTTVILIRHAEKLDNGSQDPPLSDEGIERAQRLALLLSNLKIDHIFSTPFKRTSQTVEELARMNGLEIENYEPKDLRQLPFDFYDKYAGKTIVMSGHSNTTPFVVNSLIGERKFPPQLNEDDYNDIFIITGTELGKGNLIHINY